MGVIEWLTGRDKKESDVYANFDKVDDVVSTLKKIKNNQVSKASDEVHDAINALNNVNGMAQFVGTYPADGFDDVFKSVGDAIGEIAKQLQSKANDIKTYEESAWYEKLGSTFAMTAAKLGEGILSALEDVGDGVVSLVGWVAPKDSGLEKACSNFVKKEWSHDAFNFYYKSEFAKKSAFTEDSGIASGLKIVGQTAATLYGAGVFAGATGLSALSAGTGFMQVSGTTISAATVAGVSGLGSGTESGIRQGKDINSAFKTNGLASGAIGAGLALAGGRLGEKMTFSKMAKAGANMDDVAKATQVARSSWKDVATNKALSGVEKTAAYKALGTELEAGLTSAGADLSTLGNYAKAGEAAGKEGIKRVGAVGVQGYTDALTNAGVRFGEAGRGAAQASATVFAAKSAARKADKVAKAAEKAENKAKKAAEKAVNKYNGAKGTPEAKELTHKASEASIKARDASKAATQARNTATEAREAVNVAKETRTAAREVLKVENPIAQGTRAASSGAKSTVNAVRNLPNTVKNVKNATVNGVKELRQAPVATIKNAGTTVVKAAGNVVTNPATPGVAAAGLNSIKSTVASNGAKTVGSVMGAVGAIGGASVAAPMISGVGSAVGGLAPMATPEAPVATANPGGGGGYSGGGYSGGGYSGGGSYSSPTTSQPATPIDDISTSENPVTDPGTGNTQVKDPERETNPVTGNDPIVTPPSGGGSSSHSGGGYSSSGGYNSSYSNPEEGLIETPAEVIEPLKERGNNSIDKIIKGSKRTKIPTVTTPISNNTSGEGSSVIPAVAGLSAAAAAGIGAKAYMDKKNNTDDDDEYEDDDIEEWSDEDTLNLSEDSTGDSESIADEYLNEDDEYGYQTEEVEKYGARNTEELADLQ